MKRASLLPRTYIQNEYLIVCVGFVGSNNNRKQRIRVVLLMAVRTLRSLELGVLPIQRTSTVLSATTQLSYKTHVYLL